MILVAAMVTIRVYAQPVGTGWGDNSYGQASFADSVSNVLQFSAGGYYTLALLTNGTCAIGGTFITGPAYVPGDLSNVTQVAAGLSHAMALKSNGQVAVWGDNSFNQTNIPFGIANVSKVAAGAFHCLVLLPDGTVRAWGDNRRGQTQIPPGAFGALDVAAGYYHSLVVTRTRRVLAWGDNSFGQINVPVELTDVVAVAGGATHSLALKGNGTVVSWGSGGVPLAGLSNVVAIAAGDGFSVALTRTGTVVAWGNYGSGQTSVPPGLSNVVAIAAGEAHAVAQFGPAQWPVITEQPVSIQTTQHASVTLHVAAQAPGPVTYAWWFNGTPVVGATNDTITFSDLSISNAGYYSAFVSAGGFTVESSTATLSLDRLVIVQTSPDQTVLGGNDALLSAVVVGAEPIQYQWYFQGTNALVQGTNTTLILNTVQSSNAGLYTLIATNDSGSVTSAPIQLNVVFAPNIVTNPIDQAGDLYQNISFSVKATGTAPLSYQWRFNGANIPGAIGSSYSLTRVDVDRAGDYDVVVTNLYGAATSGPATLQVHVPNGAVRAWGGNFNGETVVPIGLSNVIAVSAGDGLSAALRDDGTVVVWGRNSNSAFRPPTGLSNVVAISAGSSQILALRSDGTVVAWGSGYMGNTNVPAGLSNVVSISAGGINSLAVRADGTLAVWGAALSPAPPPGLSNLIAVAGAEFDAIGLRGDERVMPLGTAWPPPNDLSNVVAISAGGIHYVALREDGMLVHWPDRSDLTYLRVPPGVSNVAAVSAGNNHILALNPDGTVAAWGDGRNGTTNIPPVARSNCIAIAAGVSHNLVIAGQPVWPKIFTQPHPIVTNTHAAVRFEVSASSAAVITYQWQRDNMNLQGATNSFLELHNVDSKDVGLYRVLLTANHQMVRSKAASLVLFTPVFEEVQGSVEALELGTFSLSPTVIGAPPLTYQWFHDDEAIPGATNVSLTISNAALSDAGDYVLLVENPYALVLSPTISVTVWQRPRIVTDTGEVIVARKEIVLSEGANFTYSAQATGSPPLSFLWRDPGGTALSTNSTLTLTNLKFSQSGTYYVTVTSPYLALGPTQPAQLYLTLDVVPPSGRVVQWGVATDMTVPVPSGLSRVVALAAGYRHNLALKSDGTITGWGANTFGQLAIAAGKSNVVEISAAGNYSLAVLNDGTVLGAGQNTLGTLLVSPFATNVSRVSAGTNHILALRNDGTVLAWGRNNSGQLNVPTNLLNVFMVAAGGTHSLALKQDGTVTARGGNLFGQAQPPADLSNIVAIAAGYQHSMALTASGLVRAWGDNSQGQISGPAGGTNDSKLPTYGVSNIVAIAAGQDFSMALRSDGKIIAWGAQSHFYDGTTTIPPGLLNAVLIVAGPAHSLALTGVPVTQGPMLSIDRAVDGLAVSWSVFAGNFALEGADHLLGPFSTLNVPLQTNALLQTITATVPFPAHNIFLRLHAR